MRAPDRDTGADHDNDDERMPGNENEPLHRRTLIRATLPRPAGEVPTRQAPTFTIREAARAPKFRRPFARHARPQNGQGGGNYGNQIGPMMSRPGGVPSRGPQQARGKKHHAGQGQGNQQAPRGKGHQGQGNKRFK